MAGKAAGKAAGTQAEDAPPGGLVVVRAGQEVLVAGVDLDRRRKR
jgi:hypothetical protein